MKYLKLSFSIIEFLLFIFTVYYAIMWIINPDGDYEPMLFASTFIIFGIFEGVKKFLNFLEKKKEMVDLLFQIENTIVCNYVDLPNTSCVGLIFYNIKISNRTTNSFTVCNIYMEYTHKTVIKKVNAQRAFSSTIYDPVIKKDVEAILICKRNGYMSYIVVRGWEHITDIIHNNKLFQPNEVVGGSTYFLFDFKDLEEIKNVSDIKLVIEDYRNNKHIYSVEIDDKKINQGKTLFFERKRFQSNEKGELIIP